MSLASILFWVQLAHEWNKWNDSGYYVYNEKGLHQSEIIWSLFELLRVAIVSEVEIAEGCVTDVKMLNSI